MLDKIKTDHVSHLIRALQDVRVIGMVMFAVIVLLISWSGVKVIQSNYALQKQISVLQQQVDVQRLQNNNLKLQNQYYNTNQYLELSARQNFGLAAPGEKEIIVPKSVALAHLANVPMPDTSTKQTSAQQSGVTKNFEAWKNFLLHRQKAQ